MSFETLQMIVQAYAAVGAAVAGVFLLWGIARVEPNATGAWSFRPLLIPGVVLLWPLVLWRWRVLAAGEDAAARHRLPRGAQTWMALACALFIPFILTAALLARQDGPFERPALLLEPPSEAAQ
ncbi:MAG: hypothetical protein AAFQ51_07075 [Pseudomonadota bacterium]